MAENDKPLKIVENLHVGGFRKTTIATHTETHGAPVNPEIGSRGYLGLSPSARGILGLETGNIIEITGEQVGECVYALVVGAMDGIVAITGTLRKDLGVVKAEGIDGPEKAGDIISLERQDTRLVLSVTLRKDEASIADYLDVMKKRTPEPSK
ncbi:hypothetical protein HOG17_03210 [Candidatus Peregrinibacteria bacterium]|jgi:hypothetical protein|nr:hypothetical protein [Candidatus Peregrinibacteria bacterium]MBT4148216.1 hypothetical protein [Candidatus Peregrinibacteria bacterium]MBT4455980.1 hypothetical protein [Candidatus Peregrinibacteria bacterium]